MPQKTASEIDNTHRLTTQPSSDEHDHSAPTDHQASSAPITLSRMTGRGIASSRIAMLQAAQQAYGNRAVQRMLHTLAPSEAVSPTPIQRQPVPGSFGGSNQSSNLASPPSGTNNNPEAQSLYDQLIAQIKAVFQLKESNSGANSERSSQEMQKLQQLMQNYNMMTQMMSNISQAQHDTSTGIIRNMR